MIRVSYERASAFDRYHHFVGTIATSPLPYQVASSKCRKPRVVQTGFGSVGNYAVMAAEPVQDFYCSDAAAVVEALGDAFETTDRFANVTFRETPDDAVYFYRRPGLVASPVQTYLELATDDKRSRETAEQVRRVIIEALATARSEAS